MTRITQGSNYKEEKAVSTHGMKPVLCELTAKVDRSERNNQIKRYYPLLQLLNCLINNTERTRSAPKSLRLF